MLQISLSLIENLDIKESAIGLHRLVIVHLCLHNKISKKTANFMWIYTFVI